MSLSVTISSVSQTSITARVRTSGNVPMQHNWYLDGELYDTIQTAAGETSSSCAFSGLTPGTTYSISVRVFAFNPWRELDGGSTSATTEDAPMVAETYYAKLILNGNGGKTPGGSGTFEKFTGWRASWDGGADVTIDFYDPGFEKSGYSLIGWATSPSSSYTSYDAADSITVYSTSTSESNPEIVTLYAVWGSRRPGNWSWVSNVSQGGPFGLTASEWNAFIEKIKEFATYKGVPLRTSDLSSGAATSGTPMKASQANSVRSLINQLSPPTSLPESVNPGYPITADFINELKDSLNSIP